MHLSRPSIVFEFQPVSPWVDVEIDRPNVSLGNQEWDTQEFAGQFRRSVARAIDRAERPAVLFSGGLDSAAVLLHASRHCSEQGRQPPTVILIDMVDDTGVTAADVALPLLTALGLPESVHVLDATTATGWNHSNVAAWDPRGPSTIGAPHILDGVDQIAHEQGCDIVLTGDGSDELLGAPRMLGTALGRHPRRLLRYLRDAAHTGGRHALRLETAAACARLGPRRSATRLYWALLWHELCDLTPTAALTTDHRETVLDWSRTWLQEMIEWHAGEHRGVWYLADAWDSLFPINDNAALRSNTRVPRQSPFLDEEFLDYVLRRNCSGRYDDRLPVEYHRRKAAVVSLFPNAVRPALPRIKQLYTTALNIHEGSRRVDYECSHDLGLIDAARAAAETDVATVGRLAAVEHWLRGAHQAGAICG